MLQIRAKASNTFQTGESNIKLAFLNFCFIPTKELEEKKGCIGSL